ncbi:unnamed protein product, partial [Dovyalis caffra]
MKRKGKPNWNVEIETDKEFMRGLRDVLLCSGGFWVKSGRLRKIYTDWLVIVIQNWSVNGLYLV